MARIVEQFFTHQDFSKREQEVLARICDETGFEVEKLIFKGAIYEPDKVGSLIYKGRYQDKPRVLKLQGLEPDVDEIDIIVNFKKQNKSTRIRLPKLYRFQHWNKEDGFGYSITEFIDAPNIYKMPYATDEQKQLFCDFYQEYRQNALNQPFVVSPQESALEFVLRRVDMWLEIAKARKNLVKRLDFEKAEGLVRDYKQMMSREMGSSKLVFSHGHLTANDIFVAKDGSFVLLSNLYWAYRPEFYDLVFGLHFNIESLKDSDLNFDTLSGFVNDWLSRFYHIPVVQSDPEAKRKIDLMLFERNIGGILLDTGSRPQDDQFANQLFKLRLKYFNYLKDRLESS